MTTSFQELDFQRDGRAAFPPLFGAVLCRESESRSDPQTTIAESDLWISGMAKVPENISDVIVNRLSSLSHVKAILMGRSGEVYHVWTMIDEWTATARKAVYAIQRELLVMLTGFELDFYVVGLDAGVKPESLVSDIPMVFPRAA
jgi:hypothetical protein